MSDIPSSPPLNPKNPAQALRHAPAPHHISFYPPASGASGASGNLSTDTQAATPRLALAPPELSTSSSSALSPSFKPASEHSKFAPASNGNQQFQQTKDDRFIPIYVRLVPRDLWLRFHVDQRSTIGALKDTVLEKVGASPHDPSLSSYFYEEAGRSESLSLSEGTAVPSLPRSFQAKKPKPPPAHHAYQKSLSGSNYRANRSSRTATVGGGGGGGGSGASKDPSSPNQGRSQRSRMSGLSSLAPLGLALSSSSNTETKSRKGFHSKQEQLLPPTETSARSDAEGSLTFQEGIDSSSVEPLAMPSSPPSRVIWEQRRRAKGHSLDQSPSSPSSPSSIARAHSARVTPSATALGKRAVSTVLEESSSNSPSPLPHSPLLPSDLRSGEGGGALRGNEEALRLEREALENLFSSRKSVSVPRASSSSNASNENPKSPVNPPTSPSKSDLSTPVFASTSSPSSPRPPLGFNDSPARNSDLSSTSIKRPTRRKVRDFVGDEESDDLVEDSTSDDESDTRYSLNDDWSESGRASRASMLSPEPEEDSPRMTSTVLTTTDGERLWGTQLEEALKLKSFGRDGAKGKSRRSGSIVIDAVGDLSEDEDASEEERRGARKINSSGDLGSSSISVAAAAARRRSGTITMAGRSDHHSTFSRSDSLREGVEQEVGKGAGSRGELSDGNSAARGSTLSSSSSSRKDGLPTRPSNLTESSLISHPRRSDSEASMSSSNGKIDPVNRDMTPSTSANTSNSNQVVQIAQSKTKAPTANSMWAESSNSTSARRIAGINPDEISVWRNASHGLSKYYSVYSFANGHLMEDWRTVAAFRVRPFELLEIQYSNPSERAYLPRSSNLSAGSGRQSAGEIGIDENYSEPFSEGWYYVHKPGSGPSKMRKAGVGIWKLRWITVRGWKLTVHRKQPLKGDNALASSSSPSWHLGTIKWVSSEPAEIPVKPLLPSTEPLAPETLYIAFSTSGNILSSLGGGNSSGASSWSESQSLALRCITPMDHEAMFRLLTRAHYRYSIGRVDPNQSLEIESWRRKAVARAIIAGRGGTVIPGRAGRRSGRNSLSRTRLRPSGVSRDWDDADKWSSQSEEETILPKSLVMGDGLGTGAISRAVEAARNEEAKKSERRGELEPSSILLNTHEAGSDSKAPVTPRNEIVNLSLDPSPIHQNQSPHTPSSVSSTQAETRAPQSSRKPLSKEASTSPQNPANTCPASVRSRGFSLSKSRKGEEQDMSRSMSGDSLRMGSGEEESFSSNLQSSNTSGRSWRSLRPGSSAGRSRSYTVGTLRERPSTSGAQ